MATFMAADEAKKNQNAGGDNIQGTSADIMGLLKGKIILVSHFGDKGTTVLENARVVKFGSIDFLMGESFYGAGHSANGTIGGVPMRSIEHFYLFDSVDQLLTMKKDHRKRQEADQYLKKLEENLKRQDQRKKRETVPLF